MPLGPVEENLLSQINSNILQPFDLRHFKLTESAGDYDSDEISVEIKNEVDSKLNYLKSLNRKMVLMEPYA